MKFSKAEMKEMRKAASMLAELLKPTKEELARGRFLVVNKKAVEGYLAASKTKKRRSRSLVG